MENRNLFVHRGLVHGSARDLTDDDMYEFASWLETQEFQDVELQENRISHIGLAVILPAFTHVIYLDLSTNYIDDEATKLLAQALSAAYSLTMLEIEDNEITTVGAKLLAQALKVNRTLESLNLNGNEIMDEGARWIAESLEENQTLLKIHIARNRLSDRGVKAMAYSLRHNNTLATVDMHENNITLSGAKAFQEMMLTNYYIRGVSPPIIGSICIPYVNRNRIRFTKLLIRISFASIFTKEPYCRLAHLLERHVFNIILNMLDVSHQIKDDDF